MLRYFQSSQFLNSLFWSFWVENHFNVILFVTNLPNSSLSTQRWVRFPEPSSAAVWRGGPHRSRGLRCAHRGGNLSPNEPPQRVLTPWDLWFVQKRKNNTYNLSSIQTKDKLIKSSWRVFLGGWLSLMAYFQLSKTHKSGQEVDSTSTISSRGA